LASRLPDGSIQLSDGRIVYANSLILGADLCEIVPLCVPPPAWPFVSGGGGGGGGGTPGARGADGVPGANGPQGFQGIDGAAGGAQGAQGPQGLLGSQGPQGTAGTQGFQGLTGAGVQGAQGNQGSGGTQGFQGLTGSGAQGAQGNQGTAGSQGFQGFQGPQGSLNQDIFAATRVVDPGGAGTDLTIPAAITALPAAGGDIYIKPGTYAIAASLDFTTKVVRIRGAGTSVNFATGPTTLVPAAGISLFKNGAAGCAIEDMTIEGDNTSAQVLYEGSTEIRFTRIDCHDVAGIIKGTPDALFRDSFVNVPSGPAVGDRFFWQGGAAGGTLIWDNLEVFITGSGATLMSGVTAGANGPTFKVVNSYTGGGGGGGATNFWFAQVVDWVNFDFDNAQFQISGARNNIVNCNFLDFSIKFLAVWNFISNSNFSQGGTNGGGGIFDAQLTFDASGLGATPQQNTVTGCNFYGNGASVKGISFVSAVQETSISGCNFSNHTTEAIEISAGCFNIQITGCSFTHTLGGGVRYIDIGVAFRITVSGCSFDGSFTPEIRNAGFNCVFTGNAILTVSDLGNINNYSNNTGFDPSLISGSALSSLVDHTNVISTGLDTLLTDRYATVTVDASVAARTITLPTAASAKWRKYIIKKVDATANTVTVDANGAETIDGALTYVLIAQYQSVEIQSDGTTWWII